MGPRTLARQSDLMDVFTQTKRRRIMQAVRRTRTLPEQKLGRLLDMAGLRHSRNVDYLPGKPDFVFDRPKVAVFVHGCFWHGHAGCRKGQNCSKSNRTYWQEKIARNRRRDRRAARQLRQLGYIVLTVWECGLGSQLPTRIKVALTTKRSRSS